MTIEKTSDTVFDTLYQRLLQWVWADIRPRDGRLPSAGRFLARFLFILCRESRADQLNLRAAALTFTMVLSLVPLLALGTAVLKGLGAGDQMRQAAYGFIERLDESSVQFPRSLAEPEVSGGSPEVTAVPAREFESAESLPVPVQTAPIDDQSPEIAPADHKEDMTGHLKRVVDTVFDYVDRTNFATLGGLGILFLVITVISVMSTIEQSMNTIWQTESNRLLGRKVMDYLALMILLPVSVNVAVAAQAAVQSPKVITRLESVLPLVWLGPFLVKMLPAVAVVVTFTILYRFLPNTRVRVAPAIVGGLCGGIGWLLAQALYIHMQIGVARYNAIYGSFASLPLFLVWVYFGWIAFLIGAECAFTAQVLRQYSWKEEKLSPLLKLALAFEVMEVVLGHFKDRQTCSRDRIALKTGWHERDIGTVLKELVDGGILYKVSGRRQGYLPAAPPDRIRHEEIIDLILGTGSLPYNKEKLAKDVRLAALNALAGEKS